MINVIANSEAAETPYFDVNNAVAAVPVVIPTPATLLLRNGLGKIKYFAAGDNVQLVSFGIVIPPPYAMQRGLDGMQTITLGIIARGVSGVDKGNFLPFELPFGNYEMSIGETLIVPSIEKFSLFVNGANGQPYISMLNVPDSENGKRYYCSFFAKVNHTLNMTS